MVIACLYFDKLLNLIQALLYKVDSIISIYNNENIKIRYLIKIW